MKCRHCKEELNNVMVDLETSPPSNAYLNKEELNKPEKWFPLKVLVCDKCWLVQTEDFNEAEELFNEDYAYFSSFSSTWLDHAKKYCNDMVNRFNLNNKNLIIEIAANDGYLLQYFKEKNIPCLGIEPTASTAKVAKEKGIDIVEEFFGRELAKKLINKNKKADLTVANNVLAHVPDINDFLQGFSLLLNENGVATFEFPHLCKLIEENQFDTIYHEHFSYLSLYALENIFKKNGLIIFDVEELNTHGGSLRLFAMKKESTFHQISPRVKELILKEKKYGIDNLDYYQKLQINSYKIIEDLLEFLVKAKKEGKKVVGYGAAAKGNTLLNYAGIKSNLLNFVIDKNPAKQNKFLPGSRIPIVSEEILKKEKPDYILILPWNLSEEITKQLDYAREWGAKFVKAIPELSIS